MFAAFEQGAPVELESVFPDWGVYDRLGVVMHEPFGALGASHLIQLAIVLFYSARPSRRAGRVQPGDERAIYPEIYLFHVGGRHGNHGSFDFWPARKEVFIENDARAVLDAINDRAVTRLAVPDATAIPIEHEWKEPAAARDRISSAFAYSATGRVVDAEFEITGLDPITEFNVRTTLEPNEAALRSQADSEVASDPALRARSHPVRAVGRLAEGQHGLRAATQRRDALRKKNIATESYRRITVDEALQMLVPPGRS
jgi:hypothetical protein